MKISNPGWIGQFSKLWRGFAILAVAGAALGLAQKASAQVYLAADSDTKIAKASAKDQEILHTNLNGSWGKTLLGLTNALPAETAIDALDVVNVVAVYFSLETDTRLGAVLYADEDVILWNGAVFALAWDGSANGLGAEDDLDALDIVAVSPLEFTFSLDTDKRLTVGGSPVLTADEDAIRFKTGNAFTALDFDGSARGIPAEMDLDGFERQNATLWVLSFDCAGKVGALSFDDGDALSFNSSNNTFPGLYLNAAAKGIAASVNLTAISIGPSNGASNWRRFD